MREIIPQNVQEELKQCARSESDALWLIADRALEVMERFKRKQDKGLWMDINEWDVLKAIGSFCQKSPTRVRQLLWVAQQTVVECREMYGGRWGFGYFEKLAHVPHLDPYEIFEFLEQYREGAITHPRPGRVLGVGEFLMIYETHILGRNRDTTPPQPDSQGIDLSTVIPQGISFQSLLSQVRYIKRKITPFLDRPNAARVYQLAEEIEEYIPRAMEELGYSNRIEKVDKKVTTV